MDDQAQQLEKFTKWLPLANIILFLACAALITLAIIGYGTLRINLPTNVQVRLNGRQVASHSTIKLHPGTYTITIQAPRYTSAQKPLQVQAFHEQQLTSNSLTEHNPTDIFSSLIPSSGLYGPPTFTSTKWFHNDTWLVGVVGPGSLSYAALQYTDGSWKVAYYDQPSYPQDISQLPTDVQDYLQTLRGKYD